MNSLCPKIPFIFVFINCLSIIMRRCWEKIILISDAKSGIYCSKVVEPGEVSCVLEHLISILGLNILLLSHYWDPVHKIVILPHI